MSVKNDVSKNKLNCQKCENIYWSLPFGTKNIWGYFVRWIQEPRRKDPRILKRFHTTNRQSRGMQRWNYLRLFIEWFRESVAWREVRGASKIKLKKVNKKRMVTVRRVIIFLNISRRQLLICLHCCLHQYKTLKAVATAIAATILLTPAKNLNKVFLGVFSGLPLV